jgi:hypothetical protein
MDFRPLKESERKQLLQALHKNAENGGTILMNPKDTSFAGVTTEEVSDDEVISAIKSVPVHY